MPRGYLFLFFYDIILICLLTAGGTGKSTDNSSARSLEDESDDDTGLPHIFGMLLVSVWVFKEYYMKLAGAPWCIWGKSFFFFLNGLCMRILSFSS